MTTQNFKQLCNGAKNLGYIITVTDQIHVLGRPQGNSDTNDDGLQEIAHFELYAESKLQDFLEKKAHGLWANWQRKFAVLDQSASALGWKVTCGDYGPCLAGASTNSVIKYFPASQQGIEAMAEYISVTYVSYLELFGEDHVIPIKH